MTGAAGCQVAGQATIIQGADFVTPSDIWAVEGFAVNRCGCLPPPAGLFLVHWNGHRWQTVLTDTTDSDQGFAVAAHGGVWGEALDISTGESSLLFHYAHGNFQRISPPAGYTLTSLITPIPGTNALWAIASNSTGNEAILRYKS